MPGSFHGIELSSRALRAFSRALDVTGHNIANAATPGYSRQVIDLRPTPNLTISGVNSFEIGSGVEIASVSRVRDVFLEGRKLSATSQFNRYQQLSTMMDRIEGTILEPGDTGVAGALSGFFDAWSGLATSPNDPGRKVGVQIAAQNLAGRVRSANTDLRNLRTDIDGQVQQTLSDINRTLEKISQMNTEIKARTALGGNSSDLQDQRDMALTELASMIDIKTHKFEDGSINVYVGSTTLVDTSGPYPVGTTVDPATSRLGNQTVMGGRLKGLFDAANQVTNQLGRLDSLANSLRTEVNAIHMTGQDAQGNTGARFFADANPQTGAIDFDLDPAILADSNRIMAGVSGKPGDGSVALGLSRLRDTTVSGLNTRTFERFYADAVADVGRDASLAQASYDTQDRILQQTQSQIESVSGVSLDDEMANLLRYQRSYQAAAKALSVFDQVTEDLLGMLRR